MNILVYEIFNILKYQNKKEGSKERFLTLLVRENEKVIGKIYKDLHRHREKGR